ANPDHEILFCKSKCTQDINGKRNQFNIGSEIVLADNVAVELKMFAQPAALLLLVSKKLSDREPFEWFLEFAFVRRNHTSKRRREFRTQRDFAFAFVSEIEELLYNFRTAFLLVQLGRFKWRTFPFDEAVPAGNLTPACEDVISRRALMGQEITETR